MRNLPLIGIDLDGVLADSDAGWTRYFSQNNCGRKHDSRPTSWEWDCWKKLCSKCWDFVLHDHEQIATLPLMPYAEEAIVRLHRAYRMIIVTSRNPKDAPATYEWLHETAMSPFFETVIHFDDKRTILEHYKAVAHVDDAPGKIESLHDSSVLPIIFDAPYNRDVEGLRGYGWRHITQLLLNVRK